jgi:ppGpp synthetase/RelA/SpoT-type nucleotidyltranferase
MQGSKIMPLPEAIEREIKERYSSASSPYREAILALPLELQEILVREAVVPLGDSLNPDALHREASKKIKARLKGFDKILDKVERKEISASSVEEAERKLGDIVGTRIVVDYLYEVYDVLRTIEKHRRFYDLDVEDYIKHPQLSGYRGIHVVMRFDTPSFKAVVCEIQIKTQTQDSWSEKTHDLIYKAGQIPPVWVTLAKMQADCLHHTDEAFEVIKEELDKARTEQ